MAILPQFRSGVYLQVYRCVMFEVVPFQISNFIPAYPWLSESVLDRFADSCSEPDEPIADSAVRHIALDEYLFREGELKTHVYRVEAGVICVTAVQPNGPPEIVEIVFPGGYVGLGFLKRNITNAKAVVASRVRCWPLSSIPELIEPDAKAKLKQAEATEREFAFRRKALCNLTKDHPVERVAAFLVAVSRLNEVEGRDPSIVPDTLNCGVVAKYLGLDIDTLQESLVELQSRELIEQCPAQGLRICDRNKLDLSTPWAWQLSGTG